ncbi:helix-turn-helix domain-containing protein [Agromyces sp. LHK192]|uniref:AraC-like ligand-binding domain-containing protein n=1 Tax=Agromyces sp. LHK192 TaxID=2498704 RepID=UPI000FD6F654|nr:helix-turn-helix domain-containing protein [Agromyces sp. LHK192]
MPGHPFPTRTVETAGLPLGFGAFSALVSQSFVPLQVRADRQDAFHAEIRAAVHDDVQLSVVTADRHEIHRTPELVAESTHRCFKVGLQLAGTGLLIQDGREAVLRPGDLTIYDTDSPYSLVFEEGFSTLVLMVPHRALELPTEAVRGMAAVTLGGEDGLGGAVSHFLGDLAADLDQLDGPIGGRLARNAVDLVSTLYARELDVSRDAGNPHRAMLRRVQAYLEEHLGDADLSPGAVAAANFVSTRHLHALFHEEGTTVSTWIRSRRLDRCRRDLADPLGAHRPVGLVAARWGFADAAHFSRTFRAEFGESPTAFRARTLAA